MPAMTPNRIGLGTPMNQRPNPITTPKAKLRMSCAMKNRLSRAVASSIAAVVRRRSLDPASRIARFRRSSRWSRMKIVNSRIRPNVASGCSTPPATLPSVVSRPERGAWISTCIGRSAVPKAALVSDSVLVGGCSSLPISSAMSKKPEKVSDRPPRSAVAARRAVILSRRVSE